MARRGGVTCASAAAPRTNIVTAAAAIPDIWLARIMDHPLRSAEIIRTDFTPEQAIEECSTPALHRIQGSGQESRRLFEIGTACPIASSLRRRRCRGAQAPSRRYIVAFDAFSEYDAALPEESYDGVGSKGAERFLSTRQTGGGLRIGRMWWDCPYSPFAHAFRLHRKVRGHDMRCLPNAKRPFPAKSGKGCRNI